MSLQSLPSELGSNILIYLPIDNNLIEVCLSSRHLFHSLIFHSYPFAHKHLLHQYKISKWESLWHYLEACDIEPTHWPCLPLPYQAAIYGELIRTLPHYLDDDPSYWRLPHDRATLLFNLLLHYGFNPSVQDNRALNWASCNGVSPTFTSVHFAVTGNHATILQMLLSKANEEVFNDTGFNSIFYEAVTYNLVDITRVLLSVPSKSPPSGALGVACDMGYIRIVQLFLTDGRANPAAIDLTSVFKADRLDIVTLLLQDGRMSQRNLNSCLCSASSWGWTDIVKLILLDERALPNVFKSRPLSCAILKGHIDCFGTTQGLCCR
ncbi:hypothetical protein BCR33DRAFT_716714 [Rhizoclosmatium globosum]|uniref:Ankyrin n=1 Tax=Rhizoclosmatium globosum TaxID=329046 RepID=A0A1Y2CCI9_9FUNG|nr:hypothetical protein BCR33DRAFT_716714 [Rhizoclosmatium globosum]|eukprot:ORY44752.1 hypothetical protein BCR33DRAFT_716714 [Rhizoclosmatium globosum]